MDETAREMSGTLASRDDLGVAASDWQRMPGAAAAGRCAVAVMAKAPVAGRVKTRLSPPLTPEGSRRMSAAFLRDISENLAGAARAAPIDPWVAFAPAGDEHLFDGLLAPGTRLLLADGEGPMPDGVERFGRCLWQATERLLAMGYGAACVLNSDSPTLPTAFLLRMAEALAAPGDRAVLGPAEDGGYYVLGLKAPHSTMFAHIDWSTDRVAAQTRSRAREASLPLVELPPWFDVDDRAALERLLRETAAGDAARAEAAPYAAPATLACAQSLGLAEILSRAA